LRRSIARAGPIARTIPALAGAIVIVPIIAVKIVVVVNVDVAVAPIAIAPVISPIRAPRDTRPNGESHSRVIAGIIVRIIRIGRWTVDNGGIV
jgi:hypothetical protein